MRQLSSPACAAYLMDAGWPSRGWSQTSPAQCVVYTLRQQRLIGGWLLRYRPCCATCVCNAGALPFVSPQTNHTVWSHQHPHGHRAAPPCGAWPCLAISSPSMPLCNVMQHPCSDDNEGTTCCRVLPRRGCHLCSHCITTSHRCLHAGAAQWQCTTPESNNKMCARAAPSARLQPAWMTCLTRP
jgi:hypothetical protein